MHEMSLAEGIRSIVLDQARTHGFARVTCLRLEIGRFAGVEKPALEFAFDVVMRGSPAEGARLELIDLPGKALCYDCAKTVQIDDRLAPCPCARRQADPRWRRRDPDQGHGGALMCTVCGCGDTVRIDGMEFTTKRRIASGLLTAIIPPQPPPRRCLPFPALLHRAIIPQTRPLRNPHYGPDHLHYGTGPARRLRAGCQSGPADRGGDIDPCQE